MRKLKNVPIEENDSSRRLIRYFRPPVLGRRLWWSGMLWLRTKCTGTFALNSFPTGGVITQSAMPASFVLCYGLVEPNGDAQIQIFPRPSHHGRFRGVSRRPRRRSDHEPRLGG
jgi:hypothetical protein